MDTQGNIIIWGSFLSFIVMIVVGYCIHDSTIATLLRVFGILGFVAWIGFAIWLANAMNTDI